LAEGERRGLELLGWVGKGLVMRGHPDGWRFVRRLCKEVLPVAQLGAESVGVFQTLLQDRTDCGLDRPSHATVRSLYKQRLFQESKALLLEGYQKSAAQDDEAVQANFLLAMSAILQHVPKNVQLTELPSLLPLVLQTLKHAASQIPSGDSNQQISPTEEERTGGKSQKLVESALQTLEMFTAEGGGAGLVSEHAQAVTPQLLRLATGSRSSAVRLGALRCLLEFAELPFHRAFPLQGPIVRGLKPALDDPKRLVRRFAQKCRNEWIVLNSE
jgi:DNA repair/transcription protein MET18/MMS19